MCPGGPTGDHLDDRVRLTGKARSAGSGRKLRQSHCGATGTYSRPSAVPTGGTHTGRCRAAAVGGSSEERSLDVVRTPSDARPCHIEWPIGPSSRHSWLQRS